MTIIRVPTDVAVSPENGGPLRFDSDTGLLKDEPGNVWGIDELAPGRRTNQILAWVNENYPVQNGESGQ